MIVEVNGVEDDETEKGDTVKCRFEQGGGGGLPGKVPSEQEVSEPCRNKGAPHST